MARLSRLAAILLFVLALPLAAAAQPGAEELAPDMLLEQWEAEAEGLERRLEQEDATQKDYARLRAEIERQAAEIPALVEAVETAAQPLREQIAALGDPPEEGETEAESVAAERERLTAELNEVEAVIARLNQAKARAETLIAQVIAKRRALFTDRLLTRGPAPVLPATIASGVAALGQRTAGIVAETRQQVASADFSSTRLMVAGAAIAAIIAVLWLLRGVRRFGVSRLGRLIGPEATQARRVTVGISVTLLRLVVPGAAIFAVFAGLAFSGLLGPDTGKLLGALSMAAVVFVAAWALSLSFFAPAEPRLRLSTLDDEKAARAHWWVVALAGVVALDAALVEHGGELGIPIEGLILLNAVLITLGGVALWEVISQIAAREPDIPVGTPEAEDEATEEEPREIGMVSALASLARLLGRVSAVAAPLLALAGYFAASRYAFYPLVFSGAVICVCLLLYQVVQALVEQLAADRAESQADQGSKGRLRLIPVLVGFLLTAAALPVLALIWGATASDLGLVWRRAVEGVQVGDLRLAPADFFTFLLVFAVGFLLTRLIQSVLGRSVLPLTGLDTGGRDAIRAGVGYVGVILAAVVAISSAGIDLSNLALALGALTVGIGFGLQNIVNNFVSGIILLVERPIKTGDWVELTSGTGYVKQINVRSTEIETFDRSSLIVPNSELISAPVVNWTHSNSNGRIIVPVGVAYGTDPRKVERVLTEIAKAHPMLLRRPAPYVLFNRFGADALEFEIRGVLRDVNWVLNTTSDLNYEIARRFAEEGIEVPFAQRDLHLKNVEELGQAIGRHLQGRSRSAAQEADDEPPQAEPQGEQDGADLLRLADPSGAGLAGGRVALHRQPPPWNALEDAGEMLGDEPPDAEDAEARYPARPAQGDTDGAGDGR